MRIRYHVPCGFRFSLHCDAGTMPIPKPSDYALHFTYHGYAVTVAPGTSHRLTIWTEIPSGRMAPTYRVLGLSFQVQDDPDGSLQRMCTAAQWVELTQLLMGITNRALLSIRIVGGVTSLHAIPTWIPTNSPETTASPFILAEMNAETSSDDGASWQTVSCGWEGFKEAKELKDLILGIPVPGSVTAETWAGIEKALDRTEPPDFARVCLSNARESIASGDSRSAVLEGVFGLEIMVDRVVDYYCAKIHPKGARNLRNMGLAKKLFLALPPATGQLWDWFLKDDAARALTAIRDRNDIAHEGDLGPGRGDTKEFWDDVHATIALSEILLRHEPIVKSRIDHLAKPDGKDTA